MAGRIISNYTRRPRKLNRNIIIAVEGSKNKTEKAYFRNFNNKNGNIISFANGGETDPVKMVKSLAKEIERRGIDLNAGDKAYCVFDTDTDQRKNRQILEARHIANDLGIEIITSNPCIEYWFLLHFVNTNAIMGSDGVITKLKRYIPNYEKNMDVYALLEAGQADAIDRAMQIERKHISDGKTIGFVEANPSTEVYKIINELMVER